ncbi:cysteine synthase family protein [bacterium]|nr:cysteine synthase family protein [bacterium]
MNLSDFLPKSALVKINRLNANKNVEVYGKLESFNAGGSVKDRIGKSMIEAAEKEGLLNGKRILEPTSGNTGIGLALTCAVKGYPITLVMPESVSLERRKILAAYGAEFILTPAEKGTDGAIEVAYDMAEREKEKWFMPDQFNNENNWKAHYIGTGVEIWEQTEGKITMLVSAMGTTGTLMGASRKLKELNPNIKIIAVEPYLGHRLQGMKNMKEAYKPGIYTKKELDEKINIKDEDAWAMTRRLAKEEGILVGMSAGAAMHVAIKKAKELNEGLIVVVLCDTGERYLALNFSDSGNDKTFKF